MSRLIGLFLAIAAFGAAAQGSDSTGSTPASRISPNDMALVLMHGKWGRPPAPLAAQFTQAGFQVLSPEMGWSGAQAYRVTYADSLAAVHRDIEKLRASGVKKVVVGGQSFGANGALAYASLYDNIDGLMLFAPGHNPDIDRNRNPAKVQLAKSMVEKGQGDQPVVFTDYNDGSRVRDFEVPAASYLSYFDPKGLAAMPVSAQRIRKPVPVIVFMGRSDFVTTQGPGYFFHRLPGHPGSRYVVSLAGHREVPAASYDEALKWLEAVVMR